MRRFVAPTLRLRLLLPLLLLLLVAALLPLLPTCRALPEPSRGGLSVRLLGAAAAPARRYAWRVAAAARPAGLTVRGDGRGVGTVEYAVAFNRSGPAPAWLLTGVVEVGNAGGAGAAALAEVQVEAQPLAPGALPVSRRVDCASDATGAVALAPGGRAACPFALELPQQGGGAAGAVRAVSVSAQATLADGGGQIASAPAAVSLAEAAALPPVDLGRCAVLTDTFAPGPGAPAAFYGDKRPDVGSGGGSSGSGSGNSGSGVVCEPRVARYVASFGPFSGPRACGTFRAVQVARANALGGDQLAAMASTVLLLVVDGCDGGDGSGGGGSGGGGDGSGAAAGGAPLGASAGAGTAPGDDASALIVPQSGFTVVRDGQQPAPPQQQQTAQWPASAPTPGQQQQQLPQQQQQVPQVLPPQPAPAGPPAPAPAPTPAGHPEYEYSYEYEDAAGGGGSGGGGGAAAAEEEGGVSPADITYDDDAAGAAAGRRRSLLFADGEPEAAWGGGGVAAAAALPEMRGLWGGDAERLDEASKEALEAVAAASYGQQQQQQQQHGGGHEVAAAALPDSDGAAAVGEEPRHWHAPEDYDDPLSLPGEEGPAFSSSAQEAPPLLPTPPGPLLQRALQVERLRAGARRLALRRRRLQAAPAAAAATRAAAGPSIAITGLTVIKPTAYEWAARATAAPQALTLRRGAGAGGGVDLNVTVAFTRTQRATGHTLTGSVRVTNPTGAPLRLARVVVEVPRPAAAAAAFARPACPVDARGALLPVPPRGSVACAFTLAYVSLVPTGAVVARAVGASGSEYSGAPLAFDTRRAVRQALGACALVSDTPARADAASPRLLAPALRAGSKAPEQPGAKKVCGDATFAYAVRLPPLPAGAECGAYQVVTTARATPTNGTQPTVAAVAAVAVKVEGCPAAAAAATTLSAQGAAAAESDGRLAQLLATGGPLTPAISGTAAAGRQQQQQQQQQQQPGSASGQGFGGIQLPAELLGALGVTGSGGGGGSGSSSGSRSPSARLKPPLVSLTAAPPAPSAAFKWTVAATPVPAALTLRYDEAASAGFSVVYARTAAAAVAADGSGGGDSKARAAVTLSGRVALANPNPVDALALARVQVELVRPGAGSGGGGGAAVGLATCPRRAADGLLLVESPMAGAGRLECAFRLEATAADAGPGATLRAVAVLADGREAASAAVEVQPLPTDAAAVEDGGQLSPPQQTEGECATLCNRFVLLGDDGGAKLLPKAQPGVDAAGGGRGLAGEGCAGSPADVACEGRTVTYAATFGPLAPTQCGTYTVSRHVAAAACWRPSCVWGGGAAGVPPNARLLHPSLATCSPFCLLLTPHPHAYTPAQATNLAKADPTSGAQRTAAALSSVSVTVTGCPGAAVRVEVLDAAPRVVAATRWALTAFADAPSLTMHYAARERVEFSAGYVPSPAPEARLLVGALRLRNLGAAGAEVASVQVEVAPDASATGGGNGSAVAPASFAAECPLGPTGRLPAGAAVTCRFAVPYAHARGGTVVARAVLADGAGERLSRPRPFDYATSAVRRVAAGACAVAADGFLAGGDHLRPNSTSRPPQAAAPQLICGAQSVSFGARLGPFGSRACGRYLVTYVARVSPASDDDAPAPSQAASATVQLDIVGCPRSGGGGGSGGSGGGGATRPIAVPVPRGSRMQAV